MVAFDRKMGASAASTLKDAASSIFSNIAADKDVKSTLVVNAIKGVTGIAPIEDRSNPAVTVVRLRPEHGDFLDSLVVSKLKSIPSGPAKGKPSNVQIDIMPAAWPLIWKRALPALALVVGAGAVVGYMYGRSR